MIKKSSAAFHIERRGWRSKPEETVGLSHIPFAYSRLGELIYIYKTLKAEGHAEPHLTVNHGNSKSFYYRDPDGNEVEVLPDNFSAQEHQDEKRYYQCTRDFDPDKVATLYESGVPDSVPLDREEVFGLVKEGHL